MRGAGPGGRRDGAAQWEAFAEPARRLQCHLLVPCFDQQNYPDYQRLGRPGRGERADLHLIALVAHLAEQHGFDQTDMRMFGHSGGAQFVQRFTLAHPDLVRRYALSAAGWYTYPDDAIAYPMGTADLPAGFPRLDQNRYLRVPGLVFVGQRENADSTLLRRGEAIDTAQGRDRRERARRWVETMQLAARARGIPASPALVELPGGAHSFRGLAKRTALVAQVVDYLFAQAAADPERHSPAMMKDHERTTHSYA